MEERPTVKTATETRQAVKVGTMRYVLGFGIAGACIGLLAAWTLTG
jgi:heme O synthase-like polyprenyltransferase